MNRNAAFVVVAALSLSACATPTSSPPTATPSGGAGGGGSPAAAAEPFRAADFAWSASTGNSKIDGQLTYKNKGVTYNCGTVVLTPETAWVRQRMNTLYLSSTRAELPADEVRARTPAATNDYSAFVKTTTCDASGKFAFDRVPHGTWYVITVARPVAPGTGPEMALMRRLDITQGKDLAVRL
jgi:hypothetical protein